MSGGKGEGVVVRQRWLVQAYDSKLKEWYFIGSACDSIEQAERYRDGNLKVRNRRMKFQIVEESVIERIVG